MTDESPGRASWIARNAALAGEQDDADMLLTWPFLDPEQRQAEEAGAKAAITAGAPAELAAAMAETRKHREMLGEIRAMLIKGGRGVATRIVVIIERAGIGG